LVVGISLAALPVGAFCGYCGDSSELIACFSTFQSRSGCITYRCELDHTISGNLEMILWGYCCEDDFDCV